MSNRPKELAHVLGQYNRKKIDRATFEYKNAEINRRWDRLDSQVPYTDTGDLVNISSNPYSLEWFIDDRIKDNQVSAAEQMIAGILNNYTIQYVQEVSMKGLQLPSGGFARFDFLLHVDRPFLLIEYDGGLSHTTPYQRNRDALKTQWCIDRGVTLIRYNKTHYYHMTDILDRLLSRYGIRKSR